MPERDEDGFPIASRNTDAFLAPLGGVVPALSSMLDEEGGPVEPRIDAENQGPLRLAAIVTAIAIWAVLSALFRYLLAATADAVPTRAVLIGEGMTQWMHTPMRPGT